MEGLQRRLTHGFIVDDPNDREQTEDNASDTATSHRVDEYETVQQKLAEMRDEGYDLEAMRLKIQWEARQLITAGDLKSREIEKRCSRRAILKERQRPDYIQINEIKEAYIERGKVVPKLSISALVRLQA